MTIIPEADRSRWAVHADPSCNRATAALRAISGAGTTPNSNKSGNIVDRDAAEPRQSTKAPIQEITSANMHIARNMSGDSRADHPRAARAIRQATAKIEDPVRTLGAAMVSSDRLSRISRATLMGITKRIYVYSSLWSDSPTVSTSGRHPAARVAARMRTRPARGHATFVMTLSAPTLSLIGFHTAFCGRPDY
jgi:hypothetical protein